MRTFLTSWVCYREFNTSMVPEAAVRQAQVARNSTRLLPTGDNLASVLHNLSQRPTYRDIYQEMLDVLGVAYTDFDHLYFPIEEGDGKIVLRWKDRHFKRDFSAAYLSDAHCGSCAC